MFESTDAVVLTEVERAELVRRARARRLRSSDSQRAKLVLLLAEGASYAAIQERLGCSAGIKAAGPRQRRSGWRRASSPPPANRPRTEAHSGARASWLSTWGYRTCGWLELGRERG